MLLCRARRYGMCGMLGALLIACGTSSVPGVPAPTSHASLPSRMTIAPTERIPWHRRWLNGVPCSPPCWEGIIPNQTHLRAAQAILTRLPQVRDPGVEGLPPAKSLAWLWDEDPLGDSHGSLTYPSGQADPLVTTISLRLPFPFSLADVQTHYGEPEYILATEGDVNGVPVYSIALIYVRHGMLLSQDWATRLDPSGRGVIQKPTLSAQWQPASVTFFPPSDEGLKLVYPYAAGRADPDLQPWQGMHSFDFYCRRWTTSRCRP